MGILDKKRTGAPTQDRHKLLMNYFAELDKIKSKGLMHGPPREVAWTKLTIERSMRPKGEEKGVDLKFVATPKTERFASNGIIDDGSSDEFEMEKDVIRKVAKSK